MHFKECNTISYGLIAMNMHMCNCPDISNGDRVRVRVRSDLIVGEIRRRRSEKREERGSHQEGRWMMNTSLQSSFL